MKKIVCSIFSFFMVISLLCVNTYAGDNDIVKSLSFTLVEKELRVEFETNREIAISNFIVKIKPIDSTYPFPYDIMYQMNPNINDTNFSGVKEWNTYAGNKLYGNYEIVGFVINSDTGVFSYADSEDLSKIDGCNFESINLENPYPVFDALSINTLRDIDKSMVEEGNLTFNGTYIGNEIFTDNVGELVFYYLEKTNSTNKKVTSSTSYTNFDKVNKTFSTTVYVPTQGKDYELVALKAMSYSEKALIKNNVYSNYTKEELKEFYLSDFSGKNISLGDDLKKSNSSPDKPKLTDYNLSTLDKISDFGYQLENKNFNDSVPEYIRSSFSWSYSKDIITPKSNIPFSLKIKDNSIDGYSIELFFLAGEKIKTVQLDERSADNDILKIENSISLSYSDGNGKIQLVGIAISDINSNNTSVYCVDGFQDRCTISSQYGYNFSSAILLDEAIPTLNYRPVEKIDGQFENDENLSSQLHDKLEDNKMYVIDISTNIIPSDPNKSAWLNEEVFREISEKKNTTIIFDQSISCIQWIVNSDDIDTSKIKNLNMLVNTIRVNPFIDIEKQRTSDTFRMCLEGPLAGVEGDAETVKENNEEVLRHLWEFDGGSNSDSSKVYFQYYIDYLNTFDINKADYFELFYQKYYNDMTTELQFYPNGELPGIFEIKAEIFFSKEESTQFEKVDCFYLEDNGKETLIESDIPLKTVNDSGGTYSVKINHNSTYIFKRSKSLSDNIEPVLPNGKPSLPEKPVDKPNVPSDNIIIDQIENDSNSSLSMNKNIKTFDSNDFVLYSIMAIGACLSIAYWYFDFKRNNK